MLWLRDLFQRLKESEQGQTLVELALVLPILLLILFGIIEFGRVLNAQLVVNHAAREGARAGVVGASDAQIMQRIGSSSINLDQSKMVVNISPSSSQRQRGASLEVRVTYPVTLYIPFISDLVGNQIQVTGRNTMRVE